jgi:hypothetical protein
MTSDVYAVRCARCLLSIVGDDARGVADSIVEHRCDVNDLEWQAFQRDVMDLVERLLKLRHQRRER